MMGLASLCFERSAQLWLNLTTRKKIVVHENTSNNYDCKLVLLIQVSACIYFISLLYRAADGSGVVARALVVSGDSRINELLLRR